MLSYEKAKDKVAENDFLRTMQWLYCCDAKSAADYANRYLHLLNRLEEAFGKHTEAALFSAPGRTEIGGNHTDHQHGRVLAGSVNIDMIAAVAPNGKNEICVQSEGYPLCVIDLKDLEKRAEEENTTTAIIRGTCAAYKTRGAKLGGLIFTLLPTFPRAAAFPPALPLRCCWEPSSMSCSGVTKRLRPLRLPRLVNGWKTSTSESPAA